VNIKEVKDLIQEILQSDISEFELEHTGTKIKLRRGLGPAEISNSLPVPQSPPPKAGSNHAQDVSEAVQRPPLKTESLSEEDKLHYVTSPIVGTFYRAPSPGADAYVKIGDLVEEGTILCVVEAMKLMNEIPSDLAGEIVRIYVENSHPVEFGQKLFGISPRK